MVKIPLHQMQALAGYRAAGLSGYIVASGARSTIVSHQWARAVVGRK